MPRYGHAILELVITRACVGHVMVVIPNRDLVFAKPVGGNSRTGLFTIDGLQLTADTCGPSSMN